MHVAFSGDAARFADVAENKHRVRPKDKAVLGASSLDVHFKQTLEISLVIYVFDIWPGSHERGVANPCQRTAHHILSILLGDFDLKSELGLKLVFQFP